VDRRANERAVSTRRVPAEYPPRCRGPFHRCISRTHASRSLSPVTRGKREGAGVGGGAVIFSARAV
jgi:hypothetical protein